MQFPVCRGRTRRKSMANIFFPSCKAKADYPASSALLQEYIAHRFNISPIGCCRVHHKKLTSNDTGIIVCNNCAAILEESSHAGNIEFVWSIIDKDESFPFPDYNHKSMTLQDCWVAVEKRSLQDTIRSLLRKMNIHIVELADNYDQTRFCGVNLLSKCNPSNAKLAPRRYVIEGSHMFTPCEPSEQIERFQHHCKQITTDNVVCYCKFCTDAINMGGKKAKHILELLFPTE